MGYNPGLEFAGVPDVSFVGAEHHSTSPLLECQLSQSTVPSAIARKNSAAIGSPRRGSGFDGKDLPGDSKSSTLISPGGKDLLVGRSGNDRLVNSSGLGSDRSDGSRSDELMISAATACDHSLVALDAIFAIWNDRTRSVPARVATLKSGVWLLQG